MTNMLSNPLSTLASLQFDIVGETTAIVNGRIYTIRIEWAVGASVLSLGGSLTCRQCCVTVANISAVTQGPHVSGNVSFSEGSRMTIQNVATSGTSATLTLGALSGSLVEVSGLTLTGGFAFNLMRWATPPFRFVVTNSTIRLSCNTIPVSLNLIHWHLAADASLIFVANALSAPSPSMALVLNSFTAAAGSVMFFQGNTFLIGGGLNASDPTCDLQSGSTLYFVQNNFSAASAAHYTMWLRLSGARLLHDETNKHTVGICSIRVVSDSRDTIVLLHNQQTRLAIFSYIQSPDAASVNDYVSVFNSLFGQMVHVSLGQAVNSTVILKACTVDLSAAVDISTLVAAQQAIDTRLIISNTVQSQKVEFGGSFARNSHALLADSSVVGVVVLDLLTDCDVTDEKSCRVTLRNNRIEKSGTPFLVNINGSLGAGTVLNIVSNNIRGYVATATSTALRSSASLVIANNTITTTAATQACIVIAHVLTFSGFFEMWGNTFMMGGALISLGQTPLQVNVVNNTLPAAPATVLSTIQGNWTGGGDPSLVHRSSLQPKSWGSGRWCKDRRRGGWGKLGLPKPFLH